MTSRGKGKVTQITIGVDISKDTLDVHRLPDGRSRSFANDAAEHKALIAFIGKADVARIVFEPTGPYHRVPEAALANKGLPLLKVNPRQGRRFAEATGKLAKTDRIDAKNLARMGALLYLELRSPRPQILNELKELYAAREALVKDRTAAKNREKQLSLPLLKRQNMQRLAQIHKQIEAVEAEIEARLKTDPGLARKLEILPTIAGVSRVTAFAFIIGMPELGTLDGKQARKPVRPGARGPAIRTVDRPRLHSWRTGQPPASSLHAGPRGRPFQRRLQSQIRSTHQGRKSPQGRHHSHHAQARHPRKRPTERRPVLDAKTRLTKTDTLAFRNSGAGSSPRVCGERSMVSRLAAIMPGSSPHGRCCIQPGA